MLEKNTPDKKVRGHELLRDPVLFIPVSSLLNLLAGTLAMHLPDVKHGDDGKPEPIGTGWRIQSESTRPSSAEEGHRLCYGPSLPAF
jgi:hypothetical protein